MFKADFCPDSVSGLCCAKITTQPQQIIIQGTIHFNNLAEKSQNHKEQLSCRTELQPLPLFFKIFSPNIPVYSLLSRITKLFLKNSKILVDFQLRPLYNVYQTMKIGILN